MSRGQIVSILSYFRAFPDNGYKANSTAATRAKLKRGTKKRQGFELFVGAPADGKLPLGVWQRTYFAQGSALKPLLIFVKSTRYNAIFDFDYTA